MVIVLFCCFLAEVFFIRTIKNSHSTANFCSHCHLEKSSLMKVW